MAGKVEFKINAATPDGAKCSSELTKIEVKVPLLVELTDGVAFALVGGTPDHLLNHFGTTELRDALTKLATQYQQKYGAKLSFNDMSLPWGGRFDVCATAAAKCTEVKPWRSPHIEHMIGINADLRILNGNADGFPGLPKDAKLRLDLIKMANKLGLGVLIESDPPHWHFTYGEPSCTIKGEPGKACDEKTVLRFASSAQERVVAGAPSLQVQVTAQVDQDTSTGLFTYRYVFSNDAGSSAELSSIQVQVNTSAIFSIQAPQGWTGSAWQDGSSVDFTATEFIPPLVYLVHRFKNPVR